MNDRRKRMIFRLPLAKGLRAAGTDKAEADVAPRPQVASQAGPSDEPTKVIAPAEPGTVVITPAMQGLLDVVLLPTFGLSQPNPLIGSSYGLPEDWVEAYRLSWQQGVPGVGIDLNLLGPVRCKAPSFRK